MMTMSIIVKPLTPFSSWRFYLRRLFRRTKSLLCVTFCFKSKSLLPNEEKTEKTTEYQEQNDTNN